MAESRLHKLSARGQSVWIDYLSRDLLETGELKRMMEEDAVVGVTSNPTIFQKALSQGSAYDEQLKELEHEGDAKEIFLHLAVHDVESALDLLAPVHEQNAQDGYVSIEVDPTLAARATENLATTWPQATVVAADGFRFQPDQPAGGIVVNAGVTHFSSVWLDALAAENGRLLVPLTNAERWGCFLMITRQTGDRYAARLAGRVGMIPCVGGRDPAAEERLTAALARGDFTAIRSLRRAPEEPDHTCWLAGEGWWLSTAPASSG